MGIPSQDMTGFSKPSKGCTSVTTGRGWTATLLTTWADVINAKYAERTIDQRPDW